MMFLSAGMVHAQAKKKLTARKSTVSAGKSKPQEETIIVYNEDYEKGEELFKLNKPEEAIPFFEKCVEVKDVNPDVWVHLGVAYYQVKDYTRSLACCTKGLTKENTDHKLLAYNAGNSAYALTNYARAEACYGISIKEDENFGPAYLNRANSQLKQDHLQDAKVNYIKYLELEPDTPQRPEIERLLALLDAEILRRASEKPERIDLDLANVKNSEVIADDKEKVNYELPEEKVPVEEDFEELVRFEIAKAPELPHEEETVEAEIPFKVAVEEMPAEAVKTEEEVVPSKVTVEEIPVQVVQAEEVFEEAVGRDVTNAPALAEKTEVEKPEEPAPVVAEVKSEVFGREDLADALYVLPAGTVSLMPSSAGFSPNSPNNKQKKQVFKVAATDKNKIQSYTLEIIDEFGNTVRTIKGKKLPDQIEWDGKTDSGQLADGRYTARINVNYKTGGSVGADSSGFSCFSNVPQVSAVPETDSFSPDGDGIDDKMNFKVNMDSEALVEGWKFEVKKSNRTIYTLEGTGNPPADIEWDGKTNSGDMVKNGDSLSYKMSVTDAFGVAAQDNGKVDVTKSKKDPVVSKSVELSENADGSLNISIPTLSFKINSSELVNTKQNSETLQKVYDILVDEKYEDYKVTITGYINPDGEEWTTEEEVLALNRAKSVEERLKSLGVPANRLQSKRGTGKTPNKEYNRRVEFKLIK